MGANYLNDRYGTDIQVGKLRYSFPDNFVLRDVLVRDDRGDTMIAAARIKVGFEGYFKSMNAAYGNRAEIDSLKLYMVKAPGDDELNIQHFADKFSSGDSSSRPPFSLSIDDVDIRNGRVYYYDEDCDSCFGFRLQDVNIAASDFELEGSYFTGDFQGVNFRHPGHFDVKHFEADISYQAQSFAFDNLVLNSTGSYLQGNYLMTYDSMPDFGDYINKVKMDLDLEKGQVASEEIQYFSDQFPDFGNFSISGQFEGMVNDFASQNLDIEVLGQTRLSGNLAMEHTTDVDRMYFDATELDLYTTPEDVHRLNQMFRDTALPVFVDRFAYLALEGSYKGNLSDFSTDLVIDTDRGNLLADVQISNAREADALGYKGTVKTTGFNLHTFAADSELGQVVFNLRVDGRGLDPVTMNTQLQGQISRLSYNGYSYRNIGIDGRIARGRFSGDLDINDPNLKFDFAGTASFGADTSRYDFKAKITDANLYALKLSDDSISTLNAELDIDLVAENYNDWGGEITIENTTYENSQNFYFFQDIIVESDGLGRNKSLAVYSNILSAELQGVYTYSGLVKAARSHIARYVKTAPQVAPPKDARFTFDININNAGIITEIFAPELKIEAGTELSGSYESDSNYLALDVNSPGVVHKNRLIQNLDLDYSGGVSMSSLGFQVGSLVMPNGLRIDSIVLGNYFYHDTLNYNLSWIMRDSVDSYGNVDGFAIQQDTNRFLLGIYPSDFNVGYQNFMVSGKNQIVIDTAGIHIQNLVITNEDRYLTINGNISDNRNEILRVSLRGFKMDLVNYLLGYDQARFSGNLHGDVIVTQLLGQPKFAADVQVDSLMVNDIDLGDLNATSDWSVENDTISLDLSLVKNNLASLTASGYYQPDSTGSVSLDINFDRFRLAAVSPTLTGLAENIRGYVNGQVKVTGTTGRPVLEGQLALPKAAFTVSFLQTDYNLTGEPVIDIERNKFIFPNIQLRDTEYGTTGILSGEIRHDYLRDFFMDVQIRAQEMLVLNTGPESDEPYYGRAFVSGDMDISGPPGELAISANLTSERSTRFVLQLGGATEVNETEFVTFVNPNVKDSLQVDIARQLSLDKGTSLDFNLDVNPNAEVAIMVDEEGQNMLQGYGSGNLRIIVDPYSNLEIYGNYTVYDGFYNFVLQDGIIERRFDVLRGGSLSWNGDPYDALIDLTARYTTKANPGDLLVGYSGGRTLIYVDLMLSGELMNPNINFDVEAPRAAGNVQSVLNSRLAEQNSRYEQVFALLTLNQFIAEGGLFAAGSNAATTGLTLDILTSTAENYLNRFTGNVDVSLGYDVNDPTDLQQSQDEVEVGASTQFFNDRITVNGVVGVPIRNSNSANTNQQQISIDAEIEYNITEDGRFRVKAFNRPVQQYSFGQQYYQQGIGLIYRVDFDRIFNPHKKGTKEEEAEEETEEQEGETGEETDPPASDSRTEESSD